MNTDEPEQPARPAGNSTNPRNAVVAISALALVFVIASALADLAWLQWILARPWLAVVAALIAVGVAAAAYDVTRAKNIAWRELRSRFGAAFGETLDKKAFGTGRGQVGTHGYFGLRCFGSPQGLEISRMMSRVNRSLYIPWTAIAKIDVYPNLLTGRQGFETDMQAQINLREQPELTVEVPWLKEYRQLLPKSVKFRAIKLSKK